MLMKVMVMVTVMVMIVMSNYADCDDYLNMTMMVMTATVSCCGGRSIGRN